MSYFLCLIFEPSGSTIIATKSQKHQSSPKLSIEYVLLVDFGDLEIWWHYLFGYFLDVHNDGNTTFYHSHYLVGDESKIEYLITDETYLVAKKGKLKELSERDFFICVVERDFKILYKSPNIKFATNGTEIIIGSKFFGEIMGGYFSLNNQVGVFEDFRYGIINTNELRPIVHQNQMYRKAISE